jgi:hypothetical protein
MRARGISVLGCLALAVALNSCGSSSTKVSEWEEYTHNRNLTLDVATDLQGLKIPVLKAPGLERVWGAPLIHKDKDGGYVLTYTDPSTAHHRLMIHGETTEIPGLASPPPLAGADASGKEEDAGKKGYYRLVAETYGDPAEVSRWFASVSFE